MEKTALRRRLRDGLVIPAHPLALDSRRRLDERHQRALTRYYLAAGAGGLAVGVHTTQFEIHDDKIGLYQPVLELAAKEVTNSPGDPVVQIAGVLGPTNQAVREAAWARDLGYDCVLLSLAAFQTAPEEELLEHCRAVAEVLPLMGFYLQPAVGGRVLDFSFWRCFTEIEDVVAIKIAPFNRYQTIDVVRAVVESGRQEEIALYTGNDDNILADLLTPFRLPAESGFVTARIVGGLLGQWAVWTHTALELFRSVRRVVRTGGSIPAEWMARNAELTDANGAIFDRLNDFKGCIAGIHEILRRQGLLPGVWLLNPRETLSPGQVEEIERVCRDYPHLSDDRFVAEHLHEWLSA